MVKELIRKPNLLNRTISAIQHRTSTAWYEILGVFSGNILHPDLPNTDLVRLKELMSECLNNKGGEIVARRKTIELGHNYLSLSTEGKIKFLRLLAKEFDIDRNNLKKTITNYLDLISKNVDSLAIEAEMRDALEPPRFKILKQFNALPSGIKFLVDMRADLISFKKKDQYLNTLELDLCRLLSSWFDVGLLDMVEINWQSPATLLEKLIAYEAVHKIASWSDLKNRLDSDRRCFAFFHHKMPEEPLIFVEVALSNGIASNIQHLLDENAEAINPQLADSAIFYSISNAQNGLTGISFGNFLIKRVVEKLSSEFKSLKHFVTLSPIPGFRKWLDPMLESGDESIFTPQELKQMKNFKNENAAHTLGEILNQDWTRDAQLCALLQKILPRICAAYLVNAKRNGKALDPVTNFHLTNGATIERLNFLADTSSKGLQQSAGIMVNYYYSLPDIETNYERYATANIIPLSSSMKSLVRG